jgi:hypothetical protein
LQSTILQSGKAVRRCTFVPIYSARGKIRGEVRDAVGRASVNGDRCIALAALAFDKTLGSFDIDEYAQVTQSVSVVAGVVFQSTLHRGCACKNVMPVREPCAPFFRSNKEGSMALTGMDVA